MHDQAILCVDDETIILMTLKQELQSHFGDRFIYESAMNAKAALEIINSLVGEGVKIILIISDWLMPGLKGDEFLEKVYKKYPDTNVIMITGQADESAIKRVEQIPSVRAILKKPWDSGKLFNLINSICVSP